MHREEENEEEYKERIELQLAAQEEDDVERIKEESRRRRQAILEKYKQLQQQKSNVEQLSDIFTGIAWLAIACWVDKNEALFCPDYSTCMWLVVDWAFPGLNADDSSKQPEEQGQLVAAVGTNLVKQTNDDAVSLDKVYCQNGDTSVQAMPEIRLDEGSSPKVIFYFS